MTIQNIDVGSAELAGDGESIRAAFTKINSNFQELKISQLQEKTIQSSIGEDGDVAGNLAFDDNYLYLCKADYDGVSNIWARTAWGSW